MSADNIDHGPNQLLTMARRSRRSPSGSGRPMSRQELADAVSIVLFSSFQVRIPADARYIGRLERGEHRWPSERYRAAFREVFGVDTDKELGFFIVRKDAGSGSALADAAAQLRHAFQRALPGTSELTVAQGFGTVMKLPDGKNLPAVPVQVLASPADGMGAFGPLRLFTFATNADTIRLKEGRQSAGLVGNALDHAHRLDAFTAALIWAVCGFDQSLLEDDGPLWDAWTAVARYIPLPHSVGSYDAATVLSQASQAWLGSQVCAAYIQNTLPTIADEAPSYWTREQDGEEAATWLLFRHKLDYLRRTSPRGTTRAFCIPPDVVNTASDGERILLLLALALMESQNVRCKIVADPAFAEVDGFVLAGRKAIRANWVRVHALWNVEVIDHVTIVKEYSDAARYADAHAINVAPSPSRRLELAAEYLMLDFRWVRQRCHELVSAGIDSLVRPRSRLLSLDGVRTACTFLASLARD